MPRAVLPTGIELEYAIHGDPANPTLLLVNGFTSQMIVWQPELLEAFVARGLSVVVYDNRDVGLSSKLEGQSYTLSEMAADGIGLLDHLDIGRAHVAGVSMGGMIVQMMAIEHADRVASLTSIMSAPGDPRYGQPSEQAREVLLAPPPTDRDAFIEQSLAAEVWSSKRYFSAEVARRRAAAQYDRMFYPAGSPRQLAAIYATGDRSEQLRSLDVSTLVVHGRDDTLIAPSGGERTAELIPGSRYLLVSDMGHDLPIELVGVFAESIGGHVRVAERELTWLGR